MPDELGLTRDMLRREAQWAAERALSARAIPATVTMQRGPDAGGFGVGQLAQFATGYSAGVTVVPFMLDFSLLDGDDLLAV